MKIVIDLQGVQSESRHRGIGRYTDALVHEFARLAGPHHELWLVTNVQLGHIEEIKRKFQDIVPLERIISFSIPSPTAAMHPANRSRENAAELLRENFLRQLNPDIVWICSLFEGWLDDTVTSIGRLPVGYHQVVTLYDLIPLASKKKHLANGDVREWYYRKLGHLQQADVLLAISDFVRDEALELLNMTPQRVVNVSSAVSDKFRVLKNSEKSKASLPIAIEKPFVLYLGGFDERKNVQALVRAYAGLSRGIRDNHVLVLAGKITKGAKDMLRDLAAKAGLEKHELQFTGKLSDDHLVAFYNQCKLFVFPSLQEGFGLPVLEAMACGAPVLASDATSLPEVVGRKDMLFDPEDIYSLIDKMEGVLNDPELSAAYRRHGLAQAKKFSWATSAKRVLDAFEALDAGKSGNLLIDAQRARARPRMAFVAPLPPERSGIADYCAELLPSLQRHYVIDVVVDQDWISDPWITSNFPVRSAAWLKDHAHEYERIIYHFGNSPFHLYQLDLLPHCPGTVVMHDSYIGALSYWRSAHVDSEEHHLQRLFRSHGYQALIDDQIKGREWSIQHYPCNWEVLEHATGVLVHSDFAVKQVERFYGSNCAAEMRKIPFPKRKRFGSRHASREALGIASDEFVVCSFGMVAPTKLNERLLSAWLDTALASTPSCRLVFVGENHGGDYGNGLLSTIHASPYGERVRITGFVQEEDYHAWLEAADLAVQLRSESRGETSAAVYDCMAQGIPLIVNAHASFAELDSDAVLMISDAFTDKELSNAIEELHADSSRREDMSAYARDLIRSRHHPAVVAEKYHEAIENFSSTHFLSHENQVGLELANDPKLADEDLLQVAGALSCNRQPRRWRRLFVDVTSVTRNDLKTGIERVTRNIARQLLKGAVDGVQVDLVRFHDGRYVFARDYACSLLNLPRLGFPDEVVEVHSGDIFFGLDWAADVVPSQQKLFTTWRDRGASVYFLVHDLLPVLKPDRFPPGIDRMQAIWLHAISMCADGLICVSKTVASELKHWIAIQCVLRSRSLFIGYSYSGAELDNDHAGEHPDQLGESVQLVLSQLSDTPSLLMVGTVEPRKGHRQALDAFDSLWASGTDIQLVIVGKVGWMMDDFKERVESHPEFGRRLHWLRGISDAELQAIYAASTGLLVASEGEGFGLPIIEAATHGLPVIARDIPVFREVAGTHAHYFRGASGEDLSRAIESWLADGAASRGGGSGALALKVLSWAESGRNVGAMLLDPGHSNWLYEVKPSVNGRLTLGPAGLSLNMSLVSGEFISEGWSNPEAWGRWTVGQQAKFSVDFETSAEEDLELVMEADAFVSETHPEQAFVIKVNDEHLAEWRHQFGTAPPALRWTVPKELIGDADSMDVELHQPDAVSPQTVGLSEDDRVLGLAVRKIELRKST